jgi:hypothetical protein
MFEVPTADQEVPTAYHSDNRLAGKHTDAKLNKPFINKPFINKPFLIEVRQDRKQPNGSFIPAASLKLTEEFRTSGLLAALPPEDLKTLIYLLTFVSPEGHCSVTLTILTSAMKVSSAKVKQRMHRLAEFIWQGEPLIIETPHESGIFTYSLHPLLVAYEHLTVSKPFPTAPVPRGSKVQVIEYTRNHYARPRSEVEKAIAQQFGQDPHETEEQRRLRYRLENVGLTTEQARDVIANYAADGIAQQLDWLPYRNAINPAGYLLAAVEGGYHEPKAIREQRMILEQQYQADDEPKSEVSSEVSTDESTSAEPQAGQDVSNLQPGGASITMIPEEGVE